MGKDYLVRGAKLICICGSELSHLKVARKKVCTSGKKEKANCKDCKECKNIPYFGECMLNTVTHTCEGFMDLADKWQNTAVSLKKPEKVYGEEALFKSVSESAYVGSRKKFAMPFVWRRSYKYEYRKFYI